MVRLARSICIICKKKLDYKLDEKMDISGLRPLDAQIVTYLGQGLTQVEMAKLLNIEQSYVSQRIISMKAAGYLQAVPIEEEKETKVSSGRTESSSAEKPKGFSSSEQSKTGQNPQQ